MEKSVYTAEYAALLDMLREVARLTQVQLAAKLGQSQSFVSKMEAGDRRLDLIQLRTVCAALGTTLPAFVARLESRIAAGRGSKRPSGEDRERERAAWPKRWSRLARAERGSIAIGCTVPTGPHRLRPGVSARGGRGGGRRGAGPCRAGMAAGPGALPPRVADAPPRAEPRPGVLRLDGLPSLPADRPAAGDGVGGEPDTQARRVAERADYARVAVGAEGGPDGVVAAARAACRAADRAEVGGSHIGQVLAHSPLGADGQWPHEAVRAVIESSSSDDLARGFYLGC